MPEMTMAEALQHAERMRNALMAFESAADVIRAGLAAEPAVADAQRRLDALLADMEEGEKAMATARAQNEAEMKTLDARLHVARVSTDSTIAGLDAELRARRDEVNEALEGWADEKATAEAAHRDRMAALIAEEAAVTARVAEANAALEALRARL